MLPSVVTNKEGDFSVQKEKKKRRHGPEPRPPEELRNIKISVFLTGQEAAEIRQRAATAAINPAGYLRAAGLTRLPRVIPEINREAWASLARLAGNLNQYQTAINEGRAAGYPPEVLSKLRQQVQDLRCTLLGLDSVADAEEECLP